MLGIPGSRKLSCDGSAHYNSVSGVSLFALLASKLWHCEVTKVELVDSGSYDFANAPGEWLWFDDAFT